ncbi:MAG: TrkA family potassium uptake protein [Fibrella sp.]|nr:TrkA family potassium uptake protein [Armatimonadota bacterium]
MKAIIVGCGRVGATLARMFAESGAEVTIIDLTSDAFRRLGTKFRGTRLVGTGTDISVLKRAGIEGSDVFVAVTDGDNRNLMATQIAKTVFDIPLVMTRVYDPARAAAYREMGIHTLCTTSIAANLMFDLAGGKAVENLISELQIVRTGQKPAEPAA